MNHYRPITINLMIKACHINFLTIIFYSPLYKVLKYCKKIQNILIKRIEGKMNVTLFNKSPDSKIITIKT